MNEWVCAHKQPGSEVTVVHAAWLEHRPMVGTGLTTSCLHTRESFLAYKIGTLCSSPSR